jgi:hypothetical protein
MTPRRAAAANLCDPVVAYNSPRNRTTRTTSTIAFVVRRNFRPSRSFSKSLMRMRHCRPERQFSHQMNDRAVLKCRRSNSTVGVFSCTSTATRPRPSQRMADHSSRVRWMVDALSVATHRLDLASSAIGLRSNARLGAQLTKNVGDGSSAAVNVSSRSTERR